VPSMCKVIGLISSTTKNGEGNFIITLFYTLFLFIYYYFKASCHVSTCSLLIFSWLYSIPLYGLIIIYLM
jgi:hypothetical protein